MDLKKLLERKSGDIARHFGISIQAVSQWVALGRVPPARAVAVARFLGLPDTALLSPQSTGAVKDAATAAHHSSGTRNEQDGDRRMLSDALRNIGILEERIRVIDQRVSELEERARKVRPTKARRTS